MTSFAGQKAIVVGQGSAGQRHARILTELGLEVAVVSRRDGPRWHRYATLPDAYHAHFPAYVVIANETTSHRLSLMDLQHTGYDGPVLVEKPLWSAAERPLVAPPHRQRVFVGFNLRFHPALQALRAAVAGQKLVSAEIACGSWLPKWRPGRDYADTESALRSRGGGALHDLSHELDYACWLFGPWRRVAAIGGHLSNLQVDADDVALILAETDRCLAVAISLNYVERRARRSIIVNTEHDTYIADLEMGTLCTPVSSLPVAAFHIDDTYRAQHLAILGGGHDSNLCDYRAGLFNVGMIHAIEKAMSGKTWIQRSDIEEMAGG